MGFLALYGVGLCSLFVCAAIASEPRGCNVCFREDMVVIQRNYSLRENHQLIVRDNRPCSALRQLSHTYHWCKDFHLVEEEKKMVKYCCEGYLVDDTDLRCKPVCNQRCDHGACVEPDVCQCQNGWRGDSCNSSCPLDKWGPGCEYDCDCENEGLCDPVTGGCLCTEGWKGRNCSEPCPEGYHGASCSEVCMCQNNAICDHITGRCNCSAGYHGPLCEEACANGTHGYGCLDECKCQNEGICHHEDGTCECPAGWTGPICADRCKKGRYGVNCLSACECYNHATCDPVTGECDCSAGFHGANCELECPGRTWGLACSQVCNCTNGECNAIDGSCKCFSGFTGIFCNDRACPSRKWGVDCRYDCSCKKRVECHPLTGECFCSSDEEDEDCFIPYEEYYEKQIMEGGVQEETNIWKIISVICISLIALQIIIAGYLYCRRNPLLISYKDSSLLPSYAELTKEDIH